MRLVVAGQKEEEVSSRQFYVLIATLIFLGLCFFFAFGGVYEYRHAEPKDMFLLRINKLTGTAQLIVRDKWQYKKLSKKDVEEAKQKLLEKYNVLPNNP
jgi:hypothetical protein